jgi:hypothetical protein
MAVTTCTKKVQAAATMSSVTAPARFPVRPAMREGPVVRASQSSHPVMSLFRLKKGTRWPIDSVRRNEGSGGAAEGAPGHHPYRVITRITGITAPQPRRSRKA